MNYLLKIDNKEIIITSEEYNKIKEGIKNNSNLIFLRDGNLCVNPKMIKLVKETEEGTDEQIKAKDEYMKLPPEQRENKRDKGFFENLRSLSGGMAHIATGGDWKNCKDCGVAHFIPGEKENRIWE